MTFRFNGRTLLEMAQAPLSDSDMLRLVALIEAQPGEGACFVARWSPDSGVCFTATVMDGDVVGWMMFPARDEASARHLAATMYTHARDALQGVTGPAEEAAADAIRAAATKH